MLQCRNEQPALSLELRYVKWQEHVLSTYRTAGKSIASAHPHSNHNTPSVAAIFRFLTLDSANSSSAWASTASSTTTSRCSRLPHSMSSHTVPSANLWQKGVPCWTQALYVHPLIWPSLVTRHVLQPSNQLWHPRNLGLLSAAAEELSVACSVATRLGGVWNLHVQNHSSAK